MKTSKNGNHIDSNVKVISIAEYKMLKRCEDFTRDMTEDGCHYKDNCPMFVSLNHYECIACKARRALEPEI